MTEPLSPLSIIKQALQSTTGIINNLPEALSRTILAHLSRAHFIKGAVATSALVECIREYPDPGLRYDCTCPIEVARAGEALAILRDLCSRDLLTHSAMVAATMDLLEDAG